MKLQIIASSRHEHSTRSIQVVYNLQCFYSSMKVAHSVAESYKCKLRTLQDLNGCAVLHRMFKRNMFKMVHEIYKMTDKQQTRAKSKLVLTDTKRIRNVHNLADKEYKVVHTYP